MEKKLMRIGSILLGRTRYKTYFFKSMKLTNQVSYSYEVIFGNYDKIIIDDDDMRELVKKIHYVVPVAYHSRVVARMNIAMNMDMNLDMDMNMAMPMK